jgi:hypothetical protein
MSTLNSTLIIIWNSCRSTLNSALIIISDTLDSLACGENKQGGNHWVKKGYEFIFLNPLQSKPRLWWRILLRMHVPRKEKYFYLDGA